jgi:hypothetical protein
MVIATATVTVTATVIGNGHRIWNYDLLKCVCVRLYANTSVQSPRHMRVAKKSVKGGLNLQDLLCLTIYIRIIYLQTILLRFRLLGLKSIYLLREHHTKSIAERSYSLLRGQGFFPSNLPARSHPEKIIAKYEPSE